MEARDQPDLKEEHIIPLEPSFLFHSFPLANERCEHCWSLRFLGGLC